MTTPNNTAGGKKSKLYPVLHKGETRYVTVRGSDGPKPGPENDGAFETFLAEAIEAYAEASEMATPEIRNLGWAGLVVRFGKTEFRIVLKRARPVHQHKA